ncbi:hypothetical protein KKF84_13915, partial [Myxococcota bacterium]|nr:hypothetical protein [Myxococcota bacterium]MBU1536418.1 hypothetical protein [Myxococcota bacterium]
LYSHITYANCKASSWAYGTYDDLGLWGQADSPLAACEDTSAGSTWQTLGVCKNPRLDIDNISTSGIPENINVDTPTNNGTYRIGVYYYSGSLATHPVVNVYCDGVRVATYGYPVSNQVTISDSGGYGCVGDLWRVADVHTTVNSSTGEVTCTVTPLTDGSGNPNISNGNTSY